MYRYILLFILLMPLETMALTGKKLLKHCESGTKKINGTPINFIDE